MLAFHDCPWGHIAEDAQLVAWLTAYGRHERWGEWPEGPADPRLRAACLVIATENGAIDLEQLPKP